MAAVTWATIFDVPTELQKIMTKKEWWSINTVAIKLQILGFGPLGDPRPMGLSYTRFGLERLNNYRRF